MAGAGEEAALIMPSTNFSMVAPGVYRSGYPTKKNHAFLLSLRLRAVVFLCPEAYPEATALFYRERGITLYQVPMEGNKEPYIDIAPGDVQRVLSIVCDVANHPVLVHCNKGKHRTGSMIGCLRKVQGWALASAFDEYVRFAGDKPRVLDQQCIELHQPDVVIGSMARLAPWVFRRDWVREVPEDVARAVCQGPPPGEAAAGEWTLGVYDLAPFNRGRLDDWRLVVNPTTATEFEWAEQAGANFGALGGFVAAGFGVLLVVLGCQGCVGGVLYVLQAKGVFALVLDLLPEI